VLLTIVALIRRQFFGSWRYCVVLAVAPYAATTAWMSAVAMPVLPLGLDGTHLYYGAAPAGLLLVAKAAGFDRDTSLSRQTLAGVFLRGRWVSSSWLLSVSAYRLAGRQGKNAHCRRDRPGDSDPDVTSVPGSEAA